MYVMCVLEPDAITLGLVQSRTVRCRSSGHHSSSSANPLSAFFALRTRGRYATADDGSTTETYCLTDGCSLLVPFGTWLTILGSTIS